MYQLNLSLKKQTQQIPSNLFNPINNNSLAINSFNIKNNSSILKNTSQISKIESSVIKINNISSAFSLSSKMNVLLLNSNIIEMSRESSLFTSSNYYS